ncbi:Inositol monophosphatase-like [Sesbania bispinosa]|nr:Inositol monophosphatase-like [Sesbania bispinosa]
MSPSCVYFTVAALVVVAAAPVASAKGRTCHFRKQNAKYYKELEAAVDVVQRACSLCVNVKSSLFSTDGKVLEKNDQTPVTVADFGVQALISLVNAKASSTCKPLTQDDVLDAIDRGGKDAFVLDPIDGTRGFLKGSEALYVVGLALVVEGEIVLGVMGCPNWQEDVLEKSSTEMEGRGCSSWIRNSNDCSSRLWNMDKKIVKHGNHCHFLLYLVQTNNADDVGNSQILLWQHVVEAPWILIFFFLFICSSSDNLGDQCSLCKYLMVASGRSSVFILRAKEKTIIKAWDHAVGMICVNEAGGKVTDWKGSEIDLAADQVGRRIIFPSGGVLVTNGNLHNQILQIISQTSRV